MASKKVSYNDLKKQNDNSQLVSALGGKSTISQNTGFGKMKVEDIREDPKGDFVELFPFDEDSAANITQSMINHGYDKTQVIHVAKILEEKDTLDKPIRIDGAHRTEAAKRAGIEEIPVYIHTFETRTEAIIYAYELQLNRRNLEPYEKLEAMERLDALKNPGRKTGDNTSRGKSSEEIAGMLNVSTRTAERMRNIINNGDEEIKEQVKNGELSITAADKKIQQEKNKQREPIHKMDEDLEDSLSENEGIPSGLNFSHSDSLERPDISPVENTTLDEWTIEKNIQLETARKEGFADGFYKALVFALAEIKKGRTPEDVYTDEKLKDLSADAICDFILPEDDEDLVLSMY